MRGHPIDPNESAKVRLALGHNPDSDRILQVARQYKLGVSTVCRLHATGRGR